MSQVEFDPKNTIAVFTYPLPSPTNYALLANLVTILSWVYAHVIIFTGNFVAHLPEIIDDIRLSNKKALYVYDIGYKLPPRSSKVSIITRLFIYIKIQLSFITAILKLHSKFKVALFFVGVPDMLIMLIILRLFKKRIVVY